MYNSARFIFTVISISWGMVFEGFLYLHSFHYCLPFNNPYAFLPLRPNNKAELNENLSIHWLITYLWFGLCFFITYFWNAENSANKWENSHDNTTQRPRRFISYVMNCGTMLLFDWVKINAFQMYICIISINICINKYKMKTLMHFM